VYYYILLTSLKMTQTSYNNYVSNILFHYQWYVYQTRGRIVVGDCKADNMMLELAIIWEYIETLSCTKLGQYDNTGLLHWENCLTIAELQSIVQYLNKFFNLSYCVDFIDGVNVYVLPVTCTTCPKGTYTVTIDALDDEKLWTVGDITGDLKDNPVTVASCDGLTVYINSTAPLTYAKDLSGDTYMTFSKLVIPETWDRTLIYCLTIL